MTEDPTNTAPNDELVKRAREALEQQIALQEALQSVCTLGPGERAKLRKKTAKAAAKRELAEKRLRAKNLEVRNVIRRQFPTATQSQVRRMADDYMAAQNEKKD